MIWTQKNVPFSTKLIPILVLYLLIGPTQLFAQVNCPFPDSVAIADTLDPKGYHFPLEIGNVREWIPRDGAFIFDLRHEEVVADTLIEGLDFSRVDVSIFDFFSRRDSLSQRSMFSYYKAVVDSGVVSWRPQSGIAFTSFDNDPYRFNSAFKICYVGNFPGDEGEIVEVSGGYNLPFTFLDRDLRDIETYTFPAIKGFGTQDFIAAYAYGIGEIANTLTYIKIGDSTLGTPLKDQFRVITTDEVPEHPLKLPAFSAYPNPFVDQVRIQFSLSGPSRVDLEVFNVLGQRVAHPVHHELRMTGAHLVSWLAPVSLTRGIYFIGIKMDGRPTSFLRVFRQ